MFVRALRNEFLQRGMIKQAAALVTQTIVDRDDPAFQKPSKPIGSFMSEAVARERAEREGWSVVEDAGRGWRRVVPSPRPKRIVEADAIRALITAGFVVIGVGGGGIPVVEAADGSLSGVEAVIDKDFGSSLLATMIKAELFVISTAVEKVALNFNKPDQRWLDRLTLAEARQYLAEGQFHKGSMGPKIEACIQFLERGGQQALITDPVHLGAALRGETGTLVTA
jgi:carbamate kinase